MQKPESDDRTEPVEKVLEAASPAKVDFATDLFNMLSVDSANDNGSGEASAGDNSWAGFQSAQEAPVIEKIDLVKAPDKKTQPANGIENLFADSPSIAPPFLQQKPQKDVKSDILSLFDKSNMVSPFAVHQQQIAMLAQQQSLLMAATAANAGGGMLNVPGNAPQGQNISNLTPQSMMSPGFPLHGMGMAGSGNNDLGKHVQQMGNILGNQRVGSTASFPTSSSYTVGQSQNASSNGVSTTGGSRKTSAPVTSGLTQGKEYDFSSLTQGLFPK
jgi:stromal membrane-associated protein